MVFTCFRFRVQKKSGIISLLCKCILLCWSVLNNPFDKAQPYSRFLRCRTAGYETVVFSEPRTGEPVKRELFAKSVDDWPWRQWSRDTRFAKYQWPSPRRDLVNSVPQMVNSLHQSRMSVNYMISIHAYSNQKTIGTKVKSKRFTIQPN